MERKQKTAKRPTKARRRRKGPDLASMSIAELRSELERRCAIRSGAPMPEEIRERSADEVARIRQSCGVMVILEALDMAGIQGDYLRYVAIFLASGPLEKRELQDVLARLERPLPGSESEPAEKMPLRRFRKSA